MTREDLICYGKIITKIFCGFSFPPSALPVVGNTRIFIVLWW